VTKVTINGESTQALLDSGATVNLVTPEFARHQGLIVAPIGQLLEKTEIRRVNADDFEVKIAAGKSTSPLGYTILRIQIDNVKGFDEEQVALVVEDPSDFGRETPIILGTGTMGKVINVMTESEMLDLSLEWQTAMTSLKAAARCLRLGKPPPVPQEEPMRENDVLRLAQPIRLEPFETQVVYGSIKEPVTTTCYVTITEMAHNRRRRLPLGLQVMNSGQEITPDNLLVGFVLRNTTAMPMSLKMGTPVAWMTETSHPLSNNRETPANAEADVQDETTNQMTVEERQGILLEKLDMTGLEIWPAKEKAEALDMLREMHDAFAVEPGELGCTDLVEHVIDLDDEIPFKERFRKLAPPLVKEVRETLQGMLESGAIIPSDSPWCNAVVLVRKKDGTLRFCIDFRRLNSRTKKDGYPLPRINEALEYLRGSKWFAGLDLVSGFWQAKMAEDSKKYTAFTVGDLGFYQCERMPFGLCNAPATFQRLMQKALGELTPSRVMIYLDDLLVHAPTRSGLIENLRLVLERLREEGLKCKPSKCQLFRDTATCLGHEVSAEGIHPSQEKLRAVAQLAPPTTYTGVREAIGLVNHYRRFIKNFSKIAAPLQVFLSGEGSKKKNTALVLTKEALDAFELLKNRCLEAPVLALPDYDKQFLLETDASGVGLGAVLSQKQLDGKVRPVAFGSRSLSTSEKKYHSSKSEFLALKWAITDEFREYLMFHHFEVKTDNNPLTYIMTTPNLDATGHRWVAAMAHFDFSITYVKGKDNGAADALSRLTGYLDEDTTQEVLDRVAPRPDTELLNREAVKAILDGVTIGTAERAEASDATLQAFESDLRPRKATEEFPPEDKMSITSQIVCKAARLRVTIPVADWVAAQQADGALDAVWRWLQVKRTLGKEKSHPCLKSYLGDLDYTLEGKAYIKESKKFVLDGDKVYRRYQPKDGSDTCLQFVVPPRERVNALNGCHRDAGHQGQYRTISLLRDRFWWPEMHEQATKMVQSCTRCIRYDAKTDIAPLLPIVVTMPMELMHVDFAQREIPLKEGQRLKKNEKLEKASILVFTDHFTRYTLAYVVPNQTAKTVAKCLWERVISVLGAPAKLLSDQGKNFESQLIEELCQLHGIRKISTTPYHPAGNGQVERAHQTISKMIGKLENDEKVDWPTQLHTLTYAYNCTRSQITGYSPHYLMFGRCPKMPVDLFFPTLPLQFEF
jgi:hypothetical protein